MSNSANYWEKMRQKLIGLILVILTIMFGLSASPVFALEVEIGQRVQLKATKPIGVPLHEIASSSLKGRLPDQTIAEVIDTDDDKHWLKLKTDKQQGWIVDRYVSQVFDNSVDPSPTPTPIIVSNKFQVATYNVESPNFDPRDTMVDKVVQEISNNPGPIIWGLEEVLNQEELEDFTLAMGINFVSRLGTTGGQDRLAIAYDQSQLDLLGEFQNLSNSGGSRSPLVGQFKILSDGTEFLFMVNHFNRRDENKRNQQADFVRNWAKMQTLPTIIVGDFNFDYDIDEDKGNTAFDKLNQDQVLTWIKPNCLASKTCPPRGTQCNPRFNSILDAVLVSGTAKSWPAISSIIPFDCAKDAEGFPDHRIVKAELQTTR